MKAAGSNLAWGTNVGFGLQTGVVSELNQPERNNRKGVVLELNPS